MLGSDINCSLKKIDEIKKRVRKLKRKFTPWEDSQEINGVKNLSEIRGFMKIVPKVNGAVPLPSKFLK